MLSRCLTPFFQTLSVPLQTNFYKMLLADVLFLVIVVYLAYRFIFNFLLPIVRATHHVRQQFRQNFGGPGPQQPDNRGTPPGTHGARPGPTSSGNKTEKHSYKPPAEDYIDFEEIK